MSAVLRAGGTVGIDVVGTVPVGLPPLRSCRWSRATSSRSPRRRSASRSVAATDTSVLSRTFRPARGGGQPGSRAGRPRWSRTSRAGFLSGMPVSSSASRTPVAESAGAKTQVTGRSWALLRSPSCSSRLPGLLARSADGDTGGHRHRRRPVARRNGCDRPTVAGRDVGILAGLGQLPWGRPPRRHPGRLPGRRAFLDGLHPPSMVAPRRGARPRRRRQGLPRPDLLPDARRVPGLLLYRFDAPLFFANADFFRERVRGAGTRRRPSAGSSWPPSRSPMSTRPRRRHARRASMSELDTSRHRARVRGAQGSCTGETPSQVRRSQRHAKRTKFPHGRGGGFRLPCGGPVSHGRTGRRPTVDPTHATKVLSQTPESARAPHR